ncbi:hypothetical protein [Micromonospora sp. WMMD710]|uniref:hypothetical protein n=1 Tax=Micromonospora sp. WMMD710 TaxID=3016085 RepID=UPI002415CEB1|nr:hypothetical protein [Micromonospora sp. WMMD710]MDG4760811.1 hypothetical protein [Micromonospora sp. WMMD710]
MTRLIRAAGLRWSVEEDFEFGKDEFSLDQCQARLYGAITPDQAPPVGPGQIPLTVPETRRLTRLTHQPKPPHHAEHRTGWHTAKRANGYLG